MFADPKFALKNPIRRIYLFWGIIMLTAFTYPHFGQWVFAVPLGIALELFRQPIHWVNKKAVFLHTMWISVVVGGMIYNYLVLNGIIEAIRYPNHWGAWWLLVMCVPQFITGIILKSKFQMAVGVLWLLAGLYFETQFTIPISVSFFLIALITGLPYLYIAFRK